MKKNVGIGHQDFEVIRKEHCFYIDKTQFIEKWWNEKDVVTLITRPRRFGKTLNVSMIEAFFSVQYKDREDLFEGLKIWEKEDFRDLQGTYPVINLSFANIKETDYENARRKICQILSNLYSEYEFLLDSPVLRERGRRFFELVFQRLLGLATFSYYN